MKEKGKRNLQEVTDFKVMSFREAVKAIGWKMEEDVERERFRCTCDCGNSNIHDSGFFGIEVVECENCGKRLTNLFSPIQTGNSTAAILNHKDYELEKDENDYERFWVADDGKGGIKNV